MTETNDTDPVSTLISTHATMKLRTQEKNFTYL